MNQFVTVDTLTPAPLLEYGFVGKPVFRMSDTEVSNGIDVWWNIEYLTEFVWIEKRYPTQADTFRAGG